MRVFFLLRVIIFVFGVEMTAEICACDSNIATANYRIRLKIEIPARKKNVLFQLYEFIPENVGWCVICLCALFFSRGQAEIDIIC